MSFRHATASDCTVRHTFPVSAGEGWNTVWPINHLALSALIGVGMDNRAMARYFRVNEDEVARLRRSYCIR